MYNGWIESQEQIEARKARILKDYKPEETTWQIGDAQLTVAGDHDAEDKAGD
jgi:hypothetical protein